MTNKYLISTAIVLILVSCNNRTEDKSKPGTPKALEDNSYSYEKISGRGQDDIVEGLYSELLSKDNELKKLEDQITGLNKSKATESFDKFNSKNLSYYNSADRHVLEIQDSLLRDKMKLLLAKNLSNYKTLSAKHSELIEVIKSKQTKISDLHNVLKIVRTLPLINQYQADNLPNTKPLEDHSQQYEQTIQYADTLLAKDNL